MANKARGETTVEVGGQSIVLRPTIETLAEIEDALDFNITEVAARCFRSRTSTRDMCRIVWLAAKAAGYERTFEQLHREVLKERASGVVKVRDAALMVMNELLLGPDEGNAPAPEPAKE